MLFFSRLMSYSVNCYIHNQLITKTLFQNIVKSHKRLFGTKENKLVLGIETSCDDTGAAVVDSFGNVLGEAIHSQTKTHIKYGGIVPPTAQALHKEHIDGIVNLTLQRAGMTLKELDAIAVTVKPGLALSLVVGVDYAKRLVSESGLPMIPIHHMQAHALTARMQNRIDFPFLVLLMSGGHCLLTIAHDVDRFSVLGQGLDNSPGECLDKIARRLNLKSLPQCAGLCGGASVELLAKGGNPEAFWFPALKTTEPGCNFTLGGLRSYSHYSIEQEEQKEGISEGQIISRVTDLCASVQYTIIRHICRQLQRGFKYCSYRQLLPKESTLVVSGGVASNMYFRKCLEQVCSENGAQLICPPPKLCTDNGIMIAWNGIEKLNVGRGISPDPQSEKYAARCPIGEDLTKDVIDSSLVKLPRLKLKVLP